MIRRYTEQAFQLPGQIKKFTTRQWEMLFREDCESFKSIMDRSETKEIYLPEFKGALSGEILLSKRK